MKKLLLGIDRGTTNVKVAVYDLNGKEIKVSSRSCEKVRTIRAGFAEQDMNQIWTDTVDAIRGIWDDRIRPENIIGVGLSGQGGGIFFVDEKGEPVRSGIVSLDSRVVEAVKEWDKDGEHETFCRLGNNCPPAGPVALSYWMKAFEPDNYKRIRWVLQCKDWVRFKLTGEVYYETTDASNGFLLDSQQKYKLDIFDQLGLREMREKFPTLLCPWEKAGSITTDAATATGLLEGTPVAAGGHDVAMVALGAGCYKNGQLATVLGTFGLNLMTVENPHTMMYRYAKIVLGAAKDCYLMMNGASTGVATEWFLDTFCREEKNQAKATGENVFSIVENEVLCAADEGKSDIICHPFAEPPYTLDGYGNAKFGFYGITLNHTKAQIIRAYYEGVVIEMALSIAVLRNTVEKMRTFRLVGGGSTSRLFGQMFADACNTCVEVMDLKEAGCRGAALTAGIAAGVYADYEAIGRLPAQVREVYRPDSDGVAYMSTKIKRFEEIGRLIRGTW